MLRRSTASSLLWIAYKREQPVTTQLRNLIPLCAWITHLRTAVLNTYDITFNKPVVSYHLHWSHWLVSGKASVLEIGLQRSTWRTRTFMSRFVSALCVWGSNILVQGPALRAGPVSPSLHKICGGSPCSHERRVFASRWLAHSCSVSGAVKRTKVFGAQSPQSVGP